MNEITIRIECPELARAIERLAAAMNPSANSIQPPTAPQGAALPQPPAAPAPTVPQVPVSQPPVAPQVPAVPLAGAPAYTLEQLSRAGTALVDAGKMDSLLALLAKYGIQAITQLQPEQYGAFATELRALGAQI